MGFDGTKQRMATGVMNEHLQQFTRLTLIPIPHDDPIAGGSSCHLSDRSRFLLS